MKFEVYVTLYDYTPGVLAIFKQAFFQWRSQDIAVARAQRGHTTFVRTSAQSAEAHRGASSPPPNFTASQVASEAIYHSEV